MPKTIPTLALLAVAIVGVRAAEPEKAIDWKTERQFWSLRPVVRPQPPAVADSAWAKTTIDRFVLAKLEEKGLKPVGPAGKRELLRRATFDLIGLPPTPEEVDSFMKDNSADAFARVIDRLLKSPHYGERWGRHWLDVARYAEDQAHTFAVKPYTEAWRYRDWVIAAFNDDVSFDRFVKLQLAADLMDLKDDERRKQLPALGFMGLGAQYYKNSDAGKAAADELDDRIDTVTRGFLGLTVSCARCHDHKFDPIPTQDYYSLAGVFANTKLSAVPLGTKEEVRAYDDHQKKVKELDEILKATLRQERAAAAGPMAGQAAKYLHAVWQYQSKRQTDSKWKVEDQAKASELDAAALGKWIKFLDGKPQMPGLSAWGKLARGASEADVTKACAEFQKQLNEIVAESTKEKPLAKPKNDLFAAVFGDKGIYGLSDDAVKKQMPMPRRKEMEKKQEDLKTLQKNAPKLAMAHAVEETGSADMKVSVRGNPSTPGEVAPRRFLHAVAGENPAKFTKGSGRLELAECIADKNNPLTARVFVNRVWAWHFGRGLVNTPSNFGRLGDRPTHPELLDYLAARFIESGWSLKALQREIMISATYRLGGEPSVKNESIDADNVWLWHASRRRLDVESWRDAMLAVSGKLDEKFGGPTFELSGNTTRRSVYAKVSRHNLDGLLRLFDFPEANLTCERRTETTVPQQQLFVLNSPFAIEIAKALASRVHKEASDEAGRLSRLFQLCFGREPVPAEREVALSFLKADDAAEEKQKVKLSRWERLCQAVLGGNEFMYVD
jgi:Protein of unknown function (DUF1549)/Protein of unknown function (DUF1553)